ncbi:hypothetical protein D9M71_297670 [compost metagenome]
MAVAAVDQPLVQGLQFVGEVAYGADLGHARTALEGVQVSLQGQQGRVVVRLVQPALQCLAGAVEDIHRFLEEDGDHLLVQGRRHFIEGLGVRLLLGVEGGQFGQRNVLQRLGLFQQFRQRRQALDRRPVGEVVGVQFVDFQSGGAIRPQQRQGRRVHRVLQQVAQGLGPLGPGADLEGRGHLVHHADQGVVGGLGLAEETLADRQAAFVHGAINVQQGFAELFDLRQFGHFGATAEGIQFFQQRAQLLALGRMLAPAAQEVLGVEQDVHAFSEELRNHQRIASLALVVAACGVGGLQAFLVQLADALQQFFGAGDGRERGAVQLGHALAQQAQSLVQQLGLGEVDAEEVGLELLGELLQWRGDLCDRQYAGHVRTALEGVQGTLEIVVDRLRQFLVAGLDEAGEGFQVQFRLVAEDLQQLRVQRLAGLGDDGGLRRAHGLDGLL